MLIKFTKQHDSVIKGTHNDCRAVCRDCPDQIDYHQSKTIARGSRSHVNRQARMHRQVMRHVGEIWDVSLAGVIGA